ncbi:hypothetical protein [Vitiosangium sp. GDMCC 1.1324]|uniref:hypothetical protein n=1 Tax=Vitiosangium sp. (strain GDMCC 1.1324) TaxID=2138576 RepID=UPI000D3522D7|nr:hypothetical protein [Vitiosangium sp. GDMCC 1.1324]PTL81212.1 hypothetical protein DAT35_24120 [Vitiosangium sp. GDMCC 1.1324]
MRERFAAVLLALLCAGSAPSLAQAAEPEPAATATPEAAPADEETEPAAEDEAGDEVEPATEAVAPAAAAAAAPAVVRGEERWERGYQEVQSHAENVSEGSLRVSVATAVLRPSRGYIPLEVTLHNPEAIPRAVRIGVESSAGGRAEIASRQVEVGARQRLSIWLPVPVAAHGGVVRVQSLGLAFRPLSFYSVDPTGAGALVLGSERAFQSGTRLPRVEKQPKLSVRFVAPEDAPRELAAYVGHHLVVVADVTTLSADAWSALEAYASTGGYLVLLRPPRDVEQRLPLLSGTTSGGVQSYGFGRVLLCGTAEACGSGLITAADAITNPSENKMGVVTEGTGGIITPIGPPPNWQRSSQMLAGGEQPLLPGVQAPVGRFLLLITLFVLAVGPGGLALARRKGPVALLIAVPAVAFITCLAIIAWAVLVEGFSIHSSRYSLIWLDRERDRAVTVGLGGYYANLEPEGIRVPALGVLLGPEVDYDATLVEGDWTNGMVVTGGFLPSRTYREWGELAVVPTRARLVVRREGKGWRVQNALGSPLTEGYVRAGGKLWTLPVLAEGSEGVLTLASDVDERKVLPQFTHYSGPAERRFANVPWSEFSKPLPEGGFLARLSGPGLAPTAALPVELHEGVHFVRGRVDGP